MSLQEKMGILSLAEIWANYSKTPKCKLNQILVPEEGFQAQRGYVHMCQRKTKVVSSIDAEWSGGTCASHSGAGKEQWSTLELDQHWTEVPELWEQRRFSRKLCWEKNEQRSK